MTFTPIEWTSSSTLEAFELNKFKLGCTYILSEIVAPDGYGYTDPIVFTIDHAGAIYSVTESGGIKTYTLVPDGLLKMYDKPLVKVVKMDTSGNVVAGAELKITAKDDSSFTPITFTTTTEAFVIEDGILVEGKTYILSEEKAPNGFALAEDIVFAIDKDGKIYIKDRDGKDVLAEDGVITMINISASTLTTPDNTTTTTIITTTTNTKIPKTGDGTPLGTMLILFWTAIAGLFISFTKYFKHKIRRNKRLRKKGLI